MKAVKSKFNNVTYDCISVGTEGVQLISKEGVVVVVPIKLKAPNSLYKIQDIEKAINLYSQKYKKQVLPVDDMLETKGINHLFTINKLGKIVYAKSSLHSSFGKFNKSLFTNVYEYETIFVVREDKSIIALINGHYQLIFKDSKVVKDISKNVSVSSYSLFQLLCKELANVNEVREILTRVL